MPLKVNRRDPGGLVAHFNSLNPTSHRESLEKLESEVFLDPLALL